MTSHLASQVMLYMRCLDLPNKDTFSKTDAFCVVYVKNKALRGGVEPTEWTEVYRTSTIKDNLNPQWPEGATLEYRFEENQLLKFEVYDRDSKKEDLKKQDYIGWFETTVGKIVGAVGGTISGRMKNKKGKDLKKAKFIVLGEEVAQNKDLVEFQFRGEKLDRKNMMGMGRSDPFYVISCEQPDGTMVRVFESEVLKSTTKPVWKPHKVSVVKLCNGDYNRKITVDVFDWESDGKHKHIGQFDTSMEDMKVQRSFNLKNPAKKKSSSGIFHADRFNVIARHSFLDYIQGGCDMKLAVAVDFTGSNGHPSEPHSLHYMPPNFFYNNNPNSAQVNEMNDYQKVLLSVGQIVQDYDTDRKIPAYGFGAQLGPGPMDMHCFPLTLNPKVHEVKGIAGVMQAYQHSLKYVTLSGPTYFTNVINKMIETTPPVSQNNQSYTLLLIITDGVINDMTKTMKALIEASYKAISVIIVGVGDADFTPMEALDGDGPDNKLSIGGRTVLRDIVQFVPYAKFKEMGYTSLAEEVLREVPYQMESFFRESDIVPNAKRETPPEHYQPLPTLQEALGEEEEGGNDDEEEGI